MIEKYYEAKALISAYGLICDSEGGASKRLVSEVETRLHVSLPKSYKKFLEDYGVLDVEAEEFYGEWDAEKVGVGIPSVVWATESSRKCKVISPSDVRIKASGYGPNFVIDCNIVDEHGESPVFLVSSHYDRESDTVSYTREKVAESFGEFFKNEIHLLSGGG